jgi:hypothetical protein
MGIQLRWFTTAGVLSTGHCAAAWIAIGCFVLLGFVVLMVLWPRRDWEFSLAPDQFIATYLEHGAAVDW